MKKIFVILVTCLVLASAGIIIKTKGPNLFTKQEYKKIAANIENKTTDDNKEKIRDAVNSSSESSNDVVRKFTGSKLKHNDQGIPVLMYHSIGYSKDNSAVVTPERFKEEMKYLKDNGYTTLSLDEAYDFFEKNSPVPEKSVVITFDDGYEDNYTAAYPVIKEYGFKATVFVITSAIDNTSDYMNSEQLKDMDRNGFSVQSHTLNHEDLSRLSYNDQLATLSKSRETLEKLLGKPIKYIAYPFGKKNVDTPKAAEDAGYKMAFTTDGRWSDKADGIYTLDRVFISGAHDLNIFKERIVNPKYKTN